MESIQHVLDRVRSPRVHITYDVEIGGAVQKKELPFVVGIMADLSGKKASSLPKLKDRKFIEIDRDNFEEIMKGFAPEIALRVPNRLGGDGDMSVDLAFKSMDDFNPLSIAKQVAPLAKLYDSRVKLRDLLAKLDGNDELEELLNLILSDEQKRTELKDLLSKEAAAQ